MKLPGHGRQRSGRLSRTPQQRVVARLARRARQPTTTAEQFVQVRSQVEALAHHE